MKRIGLLGGMSWESTAEYYRLVNEATRDRLGGLHSADCLLRSVDFAEIESLQREGRWDEAGERLAAEAPRAGGRRRGAARPVHEHDAQGRGRDHGADHDPVRPHRRHDRGGGRRARPATRVGLLATALHDGAGLLRRPAARPPRARGAGARRRPTAAIVHDVIYDELCVGRDRGRVARRVPADHGRARRARRGGASCSAAPRSTCWSGPEDSPVPVFDTTRLHAERAVDAGARLVVEPGAELVEQLAELLRLGIGELRAQPRVVGHRDRAQPLEQGRALVGQLDALDAAVASRRASGARAPGPRAR